MLALWARMWEWGEREEKRWVEGRSREKAVSQTGWACDWNDYRPCNAPKGDFFWQDCWEHPINPQSLSRAQRTPMRKHREGGEVRRNVYTSFVSPSFVQVV